MDPATKEAPAAAAVVCRNARREKRCLFMPTIHFRGAERPLFSSSAYDKTHAYPAPGLTANSPSRSTRTASFRHKPDSLSSVPVRWNGIAPDTDCETKRTVTLIKLVFPEVKPCDSLRSLPYPPPPEPSKSIAPTPILEHQSHVARIEPEGNFRNNWRREILIEFGVRWNRSIGPTPLADSPEGQSR